MKEDFRHVLMVYFEQLFFATSRESVAAEDRVYSVKSCVRSFDLFFASIICVADNFCSCAGSSGHFRELIRQ